MPQALDEQRDLMGKWFGDRTSDRPPTAFLESHGFKLTPDWKWELPTPAHTVSCYELECVCFMKREWDYSLFSSSVYEIVCLCGGCLWSKENYNDRRTEEALKDSSPR